MTFEVQIYWKDQKTEKCKVFFILKFSNQVHYIRTLNYWSRSAIITKSFLLKMRKKNYGQCREKNKKLCKVKTAGIIIFHDALSNISYCHYN